MDLANYSGNEFENNDYLFHFTSKDVGLNHIFYEKKIKLNKLLNSQDPREFRNRIVASISNIGNSKKPEEIRKNINEIILNKVFIFCSCKNKGKEPGWQKPRMWIQYAENNTGLCLVFSKSELIKELNDYKNKEKNIVIKRNSIKYKERIPVQYYLHIYNSKSIQDNADSYVKNYFNDLIYTKHKDFRDENEYRISLYSIKKDFESIFSPIDKSLKAIICGLNIQPIYIELLKAYKNNIRIPVYKIEYTGGKYYLTQII